MIYRFEFLMVVTVLCAGLTVVFFIISSVNEAQWKFGDEESTVEISSKNTLNKFRNHETDVPFHVLIQAIYEFPFASVSKEVIVRNHSYENVFCLQAHFPVNQTHFHMKGFYEDSFWNRGVR